MARRSSTQLAAVPEAPEPELEIIEPISMNGVLVLINEMSGIAAGVARDPGQPAPLRIAAAAAAAGIASKAVPALKIESELRDAKRAAASRALGSYSGSKDDPFAAIKRGEAMKLLTDETRAVREDR